VLRGLEAPFAVLGQEVREGQVAMRAGQGGKPFGISARELTARQPQGDRLRDRGIKVRAGQTVGAFLGTPPGFADELAQLGIGLLAGREQRDLIAFFKSKVTTDDQRNAGHF
jgi:hypothetical protein